jgi:hypothetical protein
MSFSNASVSGPPPALLMMLIVLALGSLIALWAVTQVFRNRQRSELLRSQTELQLKLLDKISSSDELRGFLESESVKTLLEGHVHAQRAEPRDRIIGSLAPGCILVPVGAVLAITGQDAVRFVGVLCLTTGLGLLAAALIAYRLARSWAQIDRVNKK